MTDSAVARDHALKVGKVSLEIDYEIIEHFSKHLYSSPNKAIEELVANGFDALATKVYITLPTGTSPGHYLVWDNGQSMDAGGLMALWKLARSPKRGMGERVARTPNGRVRKIIGKFGIGKLASYTLGDEISHLCKTSAGKYYLVTVDYQEVAKNLGDEADQPIERKTYESPILELTREEAHSYLKNIFDFEEQGLGGFFDKELHWTAAIISKPKDVDLPSGRLKWVLSNGMPLRPDFQVFLDSQEINARATITGEVEAWDFSRQDLQDQVKQLWRSAEAARLVSGDVSFIVQKGVDPSDPEREVPCVVTPELGMSWGTAKLYKQSLSEGRVAEYGRSVGFFIMVRERLINPEDPLFLLPDPSYGAFNRSQYVLHVDGLDADLLADRERFNRSSSRTEELRVLQRALYAVTNAKQREVEREASDSASGTATLPVYSREYFIDPLAALLSKDGKDESSFNLSKPQINEKPLGHDGPLADIDSAGGSFVINEQHPYIEAVTKKLGTGKKAGELYGELKAIAISEVLFRGFLIDLGLSEDKLKAIVNFRNEQFVHLSKVSRTSVEQLIAELHECSRSGGKVFETKLVEVLQRMGFIADRDARSGVKDIVMFAPVGESRFKFIFEAKGKRKSTNGKDDCIANDEAEVGGASAHRKKEGAEHAVIVAPCFAGFSRGDDPIILQECREQGSDRGEGKVSIMDVPTLAELLRIMDKYHYPLDLVKDIFTIIESPEKKMTRVKELDKPLSTFNYRRLLDLIWQEQAYKSDGDVISYRPIWRDNFKSEVATIEEFDAKVNALFTLAFPHISLLTNREIALRQSPDKIAEHLQSVLSGEV